MDKQENIVSAAASIVRRDKRYVIWFYILNFVLAAAGAVAFRSQAHAIISHSIMPSTNNTKPTNAITR